MNNRWIDAIALFDKEPEEDDIDYDALGLAKPKQETEEFLGYHFRFRLNCVAAVNVSGEDIITLRLLDGRAYSLLMTMEDFQYEALPKYKKVWISIADKWFLFRHWVKSLPLPFTKNW